MAGTSWSSVFGLTWVVFMCLVHFKGVDGQILVPNHFQGDFFSMENGADVDTFINEDTMKINQDLTLTLINITKSNTTDVLGRHDANMLFMFRREKADNNEESYCYRCFIFYYRTPNIAQYKYNTEQCKIKVNNRAPDPPTMEESCGMIPQGSQNFTNFRKEPVPVNCKTTFEGVFKFTYEMNEGGGAECDSPQSLITACQEPGSPYVGNERLTMKFGKCPEVSSSYKKDSLFLCMGTWQDGTGNVWSALADDTEPVYRVRFRCLLTRYDQEEGDNKFWYTMSWWADCGDLISPYDGPLRLKLQPVVGGFQLAYTRPTCNFPTNYSGHWFHRGEFDVDVDINSTHVYFKTHLSQYTYKETYFMCVMNTGTRYMVKAVTIGKCEIDYVCFDMMPRHHSIIRWRMSKPYRMPDEEGSFPEDYMFRQTCAWSSFTIDRNDINWNYKTFLLNPPVPIKCPIRGRYTFIQTGPESELIRTRIRGITVRPRHMIGCEKYVTEWKSCDQNPTKISLDAEYCDSVDHTGRPIGEYDEPDWELSCVGYWQEDWRMYMITWDQEDVTSAFRCWSYERTDWRYLVASRSTGASCLPEQRAWSNTPQEGASLRFELEESERLYDDCAQNYESGSPYADSTDFFSTGLSSGPQHRFSLMTLLISCILGVKFML